MNPDGLSYLDLASEALHSGPSGLLNGYWSPGYPAVLGLALAVFHPSPGQEFPLVHFVNFFIFSLALVAFQFFLRRWLLYADSFSPTGDQEKRDIVPFAFCLFLWFTLEYVRVDIVTPDLCVAAIVFLIAGVTCRLSLPGSSSKHYVALGFICGLGYYTKIAMFPLGLLFLGGLLLRPPSQFITRRGLLMSLSVFLLTAAPLATALSGREGRLTLGEAGRLNYLWYINGVQPFAGWTGSDLGQPFAAIPLHGLQPHAVPAADSSQAYGHPEHPPRRLMETPLILEFNSPVKGTFPLWFDPSYWYAGAKVRFDLRQLVHGLRHTLSYYKGIFKQTLVLFSGAIVLCIMVAGKKRLPNLLLREYWLLSWPLTAMAMYAAVHVERRFLGAFFVLLWLAIYGLMIRLDRRTAVAVCATVMGALMIQFVGHLSATSALTMRTLVRSRQPDYQMVAVSLRNLGVQSGDRVAVVGYPFDAYYARYARLRVIATIPATDEFWNLSTPQLRSVAECLSRIGVKAVVAKNRPDISTEANWWDVQVSDAIHYSVLLLSEPLQKIH